MATGTTGHRQLQSIESVLLLLPQMTRNLIGLKPLRPLSPSGWMPLVTSCPLWLYCGSDWRRLLLAGATVREVFSLEYSRDDRPLVCEDRPFG